MFHTKVWVKFQAFLALIFAKAVNLDSAQKVLDQFGGSLAYHTAQNYK